LATIRVLQPQKFEVSAGLHAVIHQMFQDRGEWRHLSILDVLANLPPESPLRAEAQRLFEQYGQLFFVRPGRVAWI